MGARSLERVAHAADVRRAEALVLALQDMHIARTTLTLAHDVYGAVRGVVVHDEYVHLVRQRPEDGLQLPNQPADVAALVVRRNYQDNTHRPHNRVTAFARTAPISPRSSSRPFVATSRPITLTPSPSYGPRPQTRSSKVSSDSACELLTYDN